MDRAAMTLALRSLAICIAAVASAARAAPDPLPSWNDGAAKQRLVAFVRAVSDPSSPDHVPPAERVAVFDNDGVLWPEQPAYFQLLFAIDRVKALAARHPEWRKRQPFAAALAGDLKALTASGEKGLLELVMATHAGMTPEEFRAVVREWLATATHPRFGRRYTDLVYQPMVELLSYLRANGFKTFIVSGGGIEFLRAFSEEVYGIPPEQVVGSSIRTRFELRAGQPTIVRLPEVDFVDDKAGKPVGIQQHIGRRPIAAFGNSDGDLQMLQWTTMAPGIRLGLLVHHTDAEREYAYDRQSHVGRLDLALDEAPGRGWIVVSTKRDWARMFHE
jgi:hypothetical protein